ncbi:MAG TPA: hypothetical protein VJV23_12775 [Candidatus Polarisedimenticolia bacterium]|nr:hypothetical protein [Candidatus Polarisedimenticolia bacterium]
MPQLPPRMDPAAQAPGRAEALVALAGGHRGLRCASPLLLALHQNASRLNQPARSLLDKAVGQAGHGLRAHASPGGEFLIHYAVDGPDRVDPADADASGVPDGVERIGEELTDLLADVVHGLGWPPAPAPGAVRGTRSMVDVHLVGLNGPAAGPGRLEGFTQPRTPQWNAGALREELPEGAGSSLYLDAGLAGHEAASRPAVAHQLAHMVLLRESRMESIWWHESSATWMENHLSGNAAATAAALGGAQRRSRGLGHDAIDLSLEAFLWPHYLVQSTESDAALIRRLWEEMAAVPGRNTLEGMDQALKRLLQSSLAEEIRLFHVWNLFLGAADDGRHYPFASVLPTPREEAAFDVFPARAGSLDGPLHPLGAALARLLGDGSRGGISIEFQGSPGAAWDLALLVHFAGRPADVRYVPVEVDEAGRGSMVVPWRALAAVDLLIQNLGAAGAPPAEYSFRVHHDPTIPFDLMSFAAAASPAGAALSWSTEDEKRLAGWNILRADAPLGPFSRINAYLLPGAGLAARPMSYHFLDAGAEPGRKYYYALEAVTFEGFIERSHPAGIRLPSR